jgi:hypothetical protein
LWKTCTSWTKDAPTDSKMATSTSMYVSFCENDRRYLCLFSMQKSWQLAKQITEFITWKQVECPFDRHPPVLNYLLTNPVFSENCKRTN